METIADVYNRTIENCRFYEKEKDDLGLLNEIGALRGVAYCMEIVGVPFPDYTEFQRFIAIQRKLKGQTD